MGELTERKPQACVTVKRTRPNTMTKNTSQPRMLRVQQGRYAISRRRTKAFNSEYLRLSAARDERDPGTEGDQAIEAEFFLPAGDGWDPARVACATERPPAKAFL